MTNQNHLLCSQIFSQCKPKINDGRVTDSQEQTTQSKREIDMQQTTILIIAFSLKFVPKSQ